MLSIQTDPATWLRRAEETRQLAEKIADEETRRTLFRIAEECERLAGPVAPRADDESDS